MTVLPAATSPAKASWKTITVLTVIWAGLMISESIYISLLPLTLKRFTSDISLIGWILAIKPGLSIILQPLAGIITDRMWTPLGRRAVFLIFFAPAMGLCLYFLPGQAVFWHVVVLASFFQFFQDVLWGSDHPLLADLIPAHQRTFVMGLMTTSSQLVAFLFLWIGMGIWLGQDQPGVSRIGDWLGSVGLGWITERHDETFVYQFCAVVSTLMVGGVAFFLKEERVEPTPRPKLTLRRYLSDFLGDPILRRFGLLGFVQYFFQNIIVGFVSLFAVNTLLVSKADFGEAWKWQALVAVPAFLFGAFVERWPKNWVMGGGYALSTVACVFGYFSQNAHDLLLVAIIWGVGQLLGLLTQKPFFTEYVPKDIIGQLSGAYNTAFAISRMLALGLGGMMVKACGNDYRTIWIAGIITGLLTVWVALSIPDRRFQARRAMQRGAAV